MAFREVKDPVESGEMTERNFFKFAAIGDRLAGWYVGKAAKTANFADGPKQITEYTFRDAQGVDQIVNPPKSLLNKLVKAESEGMLTPGCAVIMKFDGTKDIGQASPLKLIALAIDSTPSTKMPKGKPYKPAAQAPAAPAVEEDVPF